MKTCFDVETTTLNKGHPFNFLNRLVSYARYSPELSCIFSHVNDPDFLSHSKHFLESDEFIGFNIKFDLHWIRRSNLAYNQDARIWDCQLAEFVLNNQRGAYGSLNDALAGYGLPLKHDRVKEYWDLGVDTTDIPVPVLEEYNKGDVMSTWQLYCLQQALMTEKQKALVYILGEDLKTIQEMEYNGAKWDFTKANEKIDTLSKEVSVINERLHEYLPDITHGEFNWDSGDHLSALLYGGKITFDYSVAEESLYKSGPNKGQPYTRNRWYTNEVVFDPLFKPLPRSEVKKTLHNPPGGVHIYQCDDPTLAQLKSRVTASKDLLKLLKDRSKILKVLEMIVSVHKKSTDMNWTDGRIHAQFNQNVVVTGRLSSSGPNLQNFPLEVDGLLVSEYAS